MCLGPNRLSRLCMHIPRCLLQIFTCTVHPIHSSSNFCGYVLCACSDPRQGRNHVFKVGGVQFLGPIVQNKIRMVYPVSSTFVLCSLQLRKKLGWSIQFFGRGVRTPLPPPSGCALDPRQVVHTGACHQTVDKSSSGDEIANVNFFLQHRTCRGQRLRPLNEFVISTKHLRYLPTHQTDF